MSVPDLSVIAIVIALLLLGIAATAWGADSRPQFSDDHRA